MSGSVLTLSSPLGPTPMVSSPPSLPVHEPFGEPTEFVSHWLPATEDVQRGHSVGILGATPSDGVPDILQPKCKKGGRVMPPCGGDRQQGGRL